MYSLTILIHRDAFKKYKGDIGTLSDHCLLKSCEKYYKLSGNIKTIVNMGHGKKYFDPFLHKDMSPFWWSKKGDSFYPPSLLYVPMSPSVFFLFLKASLIFSKVLYLDKVTGLKQVDHYMSCSTPNFRAGCGNLKQKFSIQYSFMRGHWEFIEQELP